MQVHSVFSNSQVAAFTFDRTTFYRAKSLKTQIDELLCVPSYLKFEKFV